MNPITAIAPISAHLEMTAATKAPTTEFAKLVGHGIASLNTELQASDGLLRTLAAGEPVPLHVVMIAMEKARMDLQFAVAVRNSLLGSYQQLTQMQL